MKKEILITFSKSLPPDVLIQLVQLANRFQSYILLKQQELSINAKGHLGILHLLNTSAGQSMLLIADGNDADQAVFELERFLSQK